MKKTTVSIPLESEDMSDNIFLRRVGFMGISAILLSTGIILFYNRIIYNEEIYAVYSSLQLAGITLMPYMISAAIAAITAISIMNFIPLAKSKLPAHKLALRIKSFGNGNLLDFSRINCPNDSIQEISNELTYTIRQWNSMLSQVKIINRQQWDLLQEIRKYAAKDDAEAIVQYVEKMEYNWSKTAEIENQIKT